MSMNLPKHKIFLYVVFAGIVVIFAGVAIVFLGERNQEKLLLSQENENRVVWKVPSGAIPQKEAEQLEQALQTMDWSGLGTYGDELLAITGVAMDGDWALLDGEAVAASPDSVEPTAVLTIIARRISGNWTIMRPGDSSFCEWLKELPDALLDRDDRQSLKEYWGW